MGVEVADFNCEVGVSSSECEIEGWEAQQLANNGEEKVEEIVWAYKKVGPL